VYHLSNLHAPVQINNPAIISVPLSFITLVIVSVITRKAKTTDENLESQEAIE
jgi:cation/acetate symporter